MVVGRGAYAAAGEHHITRLTRGRERTRQRGGDTRRVVAYIVCIGQLLTTCGQQLDDFGEVLVGAFAGQNFIADDDEAEVRGHTVDFSSVQETGSV